jgi:uncharacterized protein YmfQ (DUF2313 family)
MGVKTATDYLKVLQQHLPPGSALTRDPSANLTLLLGAFAQVLADVDASAAGLYDEADPRTTSQLLPDWERVCDLPDPAVGGAQQSLVERRLWLLMRLTAIGGQSAAYFIALAAQLGAMITITKYQPWGCGYGMTGRDQLSGDGSLWFLWQVNMPNPIVYAFQVGASQCGDPLGYVRTGVIEALFERYQPAWGTLIFNYGSS